MHAPVEQPVRKTTIGTGDNVFPADQLSWAGRCTRSQSGRSTTSVTWLIAPSISTLPKGHGVSGPDRTLVSSPHPACVTSRDSCSRLFGDGVSLSCRKLKLPAW